MSQPVHASPAMPKHVLQQRQQPYNRRKKSLGAKGGDGEGGRKGEDEGLRSPV